MPFVVLGLGSNKTWNSLSPILILQGAAHTLQAPIKEMQVSSIYKTAAMYVTRQEDFYNMALSGYFEGNPHQLLSLVNTIEADFGRNRPLEIRNGPRSLDIDIEIFGKEIINEENLIIPHPRIRERAFVLVPMLEILKENSDVSKEDIALYRSYAEEVSDQRITLAVPRKDFFVGVEKWNSQLLRENFQQDNLKVR